MMKSIFLVGFGGCFGSIFRYLITVFVQKQFQASNPVATFVVNITGCFLIGVLLGFFTQQELSSSNLKLLLMTGFCGGYTTFSAFALENIQLLQGGNTMAAFCYIAVSVFSSLFAVCLGLLLIKTLL